MYIFSHTYIYMHIYICIYVLIYIYLYEYSKCKESYHKYVFVHMLWNVCFSCIFQHLPTTPPHPLNPTNSTTTTKPQQLTHPALPSIYNNNHTISGGVPPPSPTHPPIFLLFNDYARNHILPPTYMLPLAPFVVACLFECCVIFLNGLCYFFQLLFSCCFPNTCFLICFYMFV